MYAYPPPYMPAPPHNRHHEAETTTHSREDFIDGVTDDLETLTSTGEKLL